MKKLICLVLVFSFMLTACSKWKVEIVDPRDPVESEQETSSEPEEIPDEELTENQKNALKYITEYEFSNEIWYKLSEKDISASFTDIKFYGDRTWKGKLLLDKYGKILEIPVEGIATYSNSDYVSIRYGKISFIDEKTAVFCGKEKAFFFSTENLEQLDINLEIPVFEDGETWVNGVGFNEQIGKYILFAFGYQKQENEHKCAEMFIYDENGKIESSQKTAVSATAEDFEKIIPWPFSHTKFFEYRGETFVHTGYKAIGLESGAEIEYYDETNLENGDYSLKIVGCSFSEEDEGGKYMAFLSKNGEFEKIMMFDGTNFSDPQYADTEDKPTFSINGDVVTYRHDHYAMTLTLDFAKQTGKIEYKPDDTILDVQIPESSSADGKYSIYTFGFNGAGDAVGYHLSLRNNETGKHLYLGKSGGMYGGYNERGFLKNNDVYLMNLSGLTILNPENGEVKFTFGKNFPFGYNEAKNSGRYLLTFRRNPKDFSFIVVYYEFDGDYSWKEVESEKYGWHEEADVNYKIGFLDAEGKLLESYDTGVPVWGDMFGIHRVDMRYSPEKLTLIVRNSGKGQSGFDGVFDMETKEFTVFEPEF